MIASRPPWLAYRLHWRALAPKRAAAAKGRATAATPERAAPKAPRARGR